MSTLREKTKHRFIEMLDRSYFSAANFKVGYPEGEDLELIVEFIPRPDFQFTVFTSNNHSYSAEGYDILGSTSSNQSEQQAIVDQYSVGKTYPCWYDPTNPTQAVLTQQFNAFIFFIPAIFFIVGGLFLIVGIVTAFRRL